MAREARLRFGDVKEERRRRRTRRGGRGEKLSRTHLKRRSREWVVILENTIVSM
jgi:hypothetical protein